MAKSPKPYWKLGKIPSFKSDFLKLTPYGQWIIGKTIGSMLYLKDPSKTYRFTNCDDCMPELYLFGVLDDGIGNKGLELHNHQLAEQLSQAYVPPTDSKIGTV